MFFLTQAIYQGYNGFTGTSLYEYWSGSVINVIFCALCIIFLGMFEQDLQASTLLAVPELYRRGQVNGAFNLRKYAWWNFMAATDAVVIYYFVNLSYGMAKFNDVFVDSSDIFAFGQLAFAICVVVINTKLLYVPSFPLTPLLSPPPQIQDKHANESLLYQSPRNAQPYNNLLHRLVLRHRRVVALEPNHQPSIRPSNVLLRGQTRLRRSFR